MTEYDPTDQPADFKAAEVRPGFGVVQFLNGKKVSRGSAFWQAANGFEVTDPNILTESPTFDFEVNSGDTVIVRARKQTVALSQHFLPPSPDPKITLTGSLSVGGSLVSSSGITKTTIADASGISFSFTVQ
jgi:Flp pilus assembly protein TadG